MGNRKTVQDALRKGREHYATLTAAFAATQDIEELLSLASQREALRTAIRQGEEWLAANGN